MNIITSYLESMFAAYPNTPRLTEAKNELAAMMEDAYTALISDGKSENEAIGQVIRDFGNLDEVAPALGITSELQPEKPIHAPEDPNPSQHTYGIPVTLDEAEQYASAAQRLGRWLGLAVPLFVLSPIPLLLLTALSNAGLVAFSSNASAFIGIVVILGCASAGVLMIIRATRFVEPYASTLEPSRHVPREVSVWAEALQKQQEPARSRALAISVALWICAALPLIGFSMLLGDDPYQPVWIITGVTILLALVALGLRIQLPTLWADDLIETLTERPGFPTHSASHQPDENGAISVIAPIYWPLVVVAFLLWSFIGGAWSISWILFPVAGVLFGALCGGVAAYEKYRSHRGPARQG